LFYKGLSTFNMLPWPIKECTKVNSFRKELIRSLGGGSVVVAAGFYYVSGRILWSRLPISFRILNRFFYMILLFLFLECLFICYIFFRSVL
jgi:hypothetical protein